MNNDDVTLEILEAWNREINPDHDKRFEEFREFFRKDAADAKVPREKT